MKLCLLMHNYIFCGRKEKLGAAYQFQKFNHELKELLDWFKKTKGLMEAGGLPKSPSEAESLIEEHHERKASIIVTYN